jgi:hypothetical protein
MALPPGYLALFAAARRIEHLKDFTREDAIWIEDCMRDQGWVIVPNWMAIDPPIRGVVVEEERT